MVKIVVITNRMSQVIWTPLSFVINAQIGLTFQI